MSCWRDDPQERPTFSEIRQFLASYTTSGLPTIEEESLLDSVMTVIIGNGIYDQVEGEDGAHDDEYVDISPPMATPTFNELIEVMGKTILNENGNDDLPCKHSAHSTDEHGNISPMKGANYVITLDRSDSQTYKNSIYDDNYEDSYEDMKSQDMDCGIHQLMKETDNLDNQEGHVRQTSITSDYVPMEPAGHVCNIYDTTQ